MQQEHFQCLHHPISPHKLLRRTLTFNPANQKLLQKIKMKRLFLKKIIELPRYKSQQAPLLPSRPHFPHPKTLKGLTQAQLTSFTQLYWLEGLKSVKTLHKLKIHPQKHSKVDHVLKYLKKLPKRVKFIDLRIENEPELRHSHVAKIYKNLASFREVRAYKRSLKLDEEDGEYVEKEYKLMSRYIKRLPNMSALTYKQNVYDQIGFQRVIRNEEACPWMTGLVMVLAGEVFRSYETVRDTFEQEESDGSDSHSSSEEEDILRLTDGEETGGLRERSQDQFLENNPTRIFTRGESEESEEAEEESLEQQRKRIMREEIMPSFRFHLFPNLRALTLRISDGCLYPLDQFVVDGFKALAKLDMLRISLAERPLGTTFIFQGLLELPSLSYFRMKIPFLKEEEWSLLKQFLAKQPDLTDLRINICQPRSTKAGYLQQNRHLENFWQFLENKPKIQCLGVKSKAWALESLSKGLKPAILPQLKILKLKCLDDVLTSSSPADKRIEGLCDFIRNHKTTLYHITINMIFALEIDVIKKLGEAIAEVSHLRELKIYMNSSANSSLEDTTDYFDQILQKELSNKVQKKLKLAKNCNPSLSTMLRGLTKLEELNLNFGIVENANEKSMKWFLDIFNVLPTLQALKFFKFSVPFYRMMRQTETKIIIALLNLKNITKLRCNINGVAITDDEVMSIEKIVEQVNDRQALRCDLMF